MLNLGSTYLIVKDMEKSITFYEALLQMKASVLRFDRWVEFNFSGHCIALLNPKYDEELIGSKQDLQAHYNRAYIEHLKRKTVYGNNMVLNFYIDDLNKEYKRIKELNIGKLSDIMYINISSPYYHFVVDDPDGNTIEVTGGYTEE